MCGATSEQKSMQAKQAAFYDTMTKQYNEVYGKQQGILDKLTATFQPILAKGPNQHGFDDETRTNLETQSSESTARGYAAATKTLSEARAARGGSDFIPSGVDAQLDANLASSAENQDAGQKQEISLADLDAGHKNFLTAADALSGVASQNNSSNFANSTTNAGHEAADTANQIAAASNSMWNSVIGGLSGVAGQAVGGWANGMASKKPCWIAAVLYGGWEEPRTVLVREWLTSTFENTWYGRPVMAIYRAFGERVAIEISRHPILKGIFKPFFDAALRRAQEAKN